VLASRRPLAGPFQCVEYLGFLRVFGPVFHLAGFPMEVHTFLLNLLECFKTIFDTTVKSGILRLALSINSVWAELT
jgi:hypothetical protein